MTRSRSEMSPSLMPNTADRRELPPAPNGDCAVSQLQVRQGLMDRGCGTDGVPK